MGLFDDITGGDTFGTPGPLQPQPERSAGTFDSFLKLGSGALFKTLDFLDLSGQAVRKGLAGDFEGSLRDFLSSGAALGVGLGDTLVLEDTGRFGGADLLRQSDFASSILQDENDRLFGLSDLDVAGLGAEYLLDPLTYVGGFAGKGVARGVAESFQSATRFTEGLAGVQRRASKVNEAGRWLADALEGGGAAALPIGGAIGGGAAGAQLAEEGQTLPGIAFGAIAGGLSGGIVRRGVPKAAGLALDIGDTFSDSFRRTRTLAGGADDANRLESLLNRGITTQQLIQADNARLLQANRDLLTSLMDDSATRWVSQRTGEEIATVEEALRELTFVGEQLGTREAVAVRRGADPTRLTLGGGTGKVPQWLLDQQSAVLDALPTEAQQILTNYFTGLDGAKFLPGKIAADLNQVQRGILDRQFIDGFIRTHKIGHLPHIQNAATAQELARALMTELDAIPAAAARKTLGGKIAAAREAANASGAKRGNVARLLTGSIEDLDKQFPGLLETDFLKIASEDANRYAARTAADDIITHVANDTEWSLARGGGEATQMLDGVLYRSVPEATLPPSMRGKFTDRLIRADIHAELFDPKHGVAHRMLSPDAPRRLIEGWKKLQRVWSQWTLGPFAGWWSRNLVGNFWNSWVAGGVGQFKDSQVLQDAIASVMNGLPVEGSIRVGKKTLSGKQLAAFAEEALRSGVIGNGFTMTEAGLQHLRFLSGKEFNLVPASLGGAAAGAGAGAATAAATDTDPLSGAASGALVGATAGAFGAAAVKTGLKGKSLRKGGAQAIKDMIAFDPQQNLWVRSGFGLNGVLEDYFRVQHYLVKRSAGLSADDAIRSVSKSLGNFRDISRGDEAVKLVAPFWQWSRFNIPRQFRSFAEAPRKIINMGRIKVALDEEFRADVPDEVVPEWLQGQLAVPVRRSSDGRLELYSFNRWLPIADLTEIDSPQKMGEMLMGQLSPFIKVAPEVLINRNSFFGTQIERYPGEMEHFFGIPLSKKWTHVLRNARVLSEFDRTWGPILGFTPASDRLQRELAELTPGQTALRAATGLKARPIDLQAQRKRRMRATRSLISRLRSDLKRATRDNNANEAAMLTQRIADERAHLQFLAKFDFRRNPHFQANR